MNPEASFQRVLLVNNFKLWKMVESDIHVYNILHCGKGEEYGRIAAVNLRCAAPIRRKATETEGLVINKL